MVNFERKLLKNKSKLKVKENVTFKSNFDAEQINKLFSDLSFIKHYTA